MASPRHRIAFAFPPMAGHLNPSLALARRLVGLGHDVRYFAHASVAEVVQATGASLHSAGNDLSALGVFEKLVEEHGLKPAGTNTGNIILNFTKVQNLALEMLLPAALQSLRALNPNVLVYDPMILCRDFLFAAQLLGIPAVSILTVAGPGGYHDHISAGVSEEEWIKELEDFHPNTAATERLNQAYDLGLQVITRPRLLLEKADLHIVTTVESLQDPVAPFLATAYKDQGAKFEFVGPMLDQPGSARVGGGVDEKSTSVLDAAREARAKGRRIVMVSMGTVLTSDLKGTGWHGRPVDANGREHGLSGQELCQAAWGGAFDAFGAACEADGPLLLVSLGNRNDALKGLTPPPNALCVKGLPQLDLLRIGVSAFLTHGGQNSFMESMHTGTPLVVCPGFGDQVVNAQKAVDLGVGLRVPRPDAEPGQQEPAAAAYRQDVRRALARVAAEAAFGEAAGRVAGELREAGGVEQAADLVLERALPRALPKMGGA